MLTCALVYLETTPHPHRTSAYGSGYEAQSSSYVGSDRPGAPAEDDAYRGEESAAAVDHDYVYHYESGPDPNDGRVTYDNVQDDYEDASGDDFGDGYDYGMTIRAAVVTTTMTTEC
jgi:hypothetical protein